VCFRTARFAYGIRARREARRAPSSRSPMSGSASRDRVSELAAGFSNRKSSCRCDVRERCGDLRDVRELALQRWDGLERSGASRSHSRRARRSQARLLDGLSREAFRQAHDISAYKLPGSREKPRWADAPRGATASLTDADLSRARSERLTALQHDGALRRRASRQACANLAANPRAEGNPRQRDFSAGPIRHASRQVHRPARQNAEHVEEHAARCVERGRSTTWKRPRCFCLRRLPSGITRRGDGT